MTPAGLSAAQTDDGPTDGQAVFRVLAESVRHGQCILFLGAGVHYPPPVDSRFSYPEEQRPPLGQQLAMRLASGCNFVREVPGDAPTDLKRVSLCYEKVLGRGRLVNEISSAVEERAKPSAAVRALAELPFRLIITTNYDTLFERALRRLDKDPVVGAYDPVGATATPDYPLHGEPSTDRPFVFKVHGDINQPASIVVTDEDYIDFVLRMTAGDAFHPIPSTFRFQFARWPTLFVGYSLMDYNLRLLFRTLRWRIDAAQHPDSYSVDLHPDPLISDVWQRKQGFRFIAEDVWEFVPRLYTEVLGREMPL
jgi:SIR2-like domain